MLHRNISTKNSRKELSFRQNTFDWNEFIDYLNKFQKIEMVTVKIQPFLIHELELFQNVFIYISSLILKESQCSMRWYRSCHTQSIPVFQDKDRPKNWFLISFNMVIFRVWRPFSYLTNNWKLFLAYRLGYTAFLSEFSITCFDIELVRQVQVRLNSGIEFCETRYLHLFIQFRLPEF